MTSTLPANQREIATLFRFTYPIAQLKYLLRRLNIPAALRVVARGLSRKKAAPKSRPSALAVCVKGSRKRNEAGIAQCAQH